MEELLKFEFEEHFDRLVKWFRIKMTSDQAAMSFKRIKHLPLEAFKFSVDYFIENSRPTPGNFPTINELVNKCYDFIESNPGLKFERTVFDRIDDHRYPVQKLWDAYNVLIRYDIDRFKQFAIDNRMPRNDIERVLMKVGYDGGIVDDVLLSLKFQLPELPSWMDRTDPLIDVAKQVKGMINKIGRPL